MLRRYSLCNVRVGPTLRRRIFKNPQIIVEIIIRASVRPFFLSRRAPHCRVAGVLESVPFVLG